LADDVISAVVAAPPDVLDVVAEASKQHGQAALGRSPFDPVDLAVYVYLPL
jgi:hypothetical protein